MQTSTPQLPAVPKTKKTTSPSKRKTSSSAKVEASTEGPIDIYTAQVQQQQERHLKMEHVAQMAAQDKLHKERIAAMFEQLQTQLFTIWNEVWLQRRKVHDEAFKAWLKLFTS